MKRKSILALAFFSISTTTFAQEVTFKLAHFLPSSASPQQRVLQPWCEEMKKASNNKIACQFYPSMQLGGTPSQLVDQVKNGVADIVWTAPGYSTGRFPAIETFELPFLVSDATNSSKAVWKFYQQHAQQEFSAFKVLAIHTDGGQAIHTAKGPVSGLTGLSGLKLRTSTRLGARTFAALGGIPVAMPPAQVTEAVSKGVVDGSFAAWNLVVPTKLPEVTKFHTQPAAGAAYPTATVLMVLMNKQKYDGLPADLKAVIDRFSGESLVNRFGSVFDDETVAGRKIVQQRGGKITEFSPIEVAAMKRATASVEEEWAKQVGEKGLDGKKLIASARELTGTNK
jgi:TRAP-type C4-dicarboxylate transport system substrate-binding protein